MNQSLTILSLSQSPKESLFPSIPNGDTRGRNQISPAPKEEPPRPAVFFGVFGGLEQSKPGKNMETWRFLLEKILKLFHIHFYSVKFQ